MVDTRQLAIKTGVVNRLVKEVKAYKQEALAQQKKVEQMEINKEDEYEVKQQRRVHQDSLQMIPDSEKRLQKALAELEEAVEDAEDSLKDAPELAAARDSLKLAQEGIQ
ncbi:hypothetical protein OIV83_006128 [Microbotryomycetes sp. JL201]|nr:hypothetical protein OIV83_006128 [Microbotryomycetes sp. JL201]